MADTLDLTHEVVAPPEDASSIIRQRAWTADDLADRSWVLEIDPPALDELHGLIATLRAKPLPLLLRTPDGMAIPHLRKLYAHAKDRLDQGPGFVVLDRLPIDDYDIDEILACYWILGQLLAPTVAQKWDGTMIYDVTDTKQAYSYGVRGSATNVELVFHTDNAFGARVPDYVGLLCKYPAATGGLSRFCSLYALHDRLERAHPAALRRLYQPMYFDRQAEHPSDAAKISFAPFFSWRDGRLMCRANSSLVQKGHDVAGVPMDPGLEAALDAVDHVTKSDDLWVEAPLERGQVQYLNNHELGHYRSAFTDGDDPTKKRHLYRLWHRSEGDRTYDGRMATS
ncbi:MAG: TauD/TfdA family dioxygenase [Alphaproteobacteria bacterium]|nr:TauD/TfdA family dioxygenase [Alphaproteobacteria bacterium]